MEPITISTKVKHSIALSDDPNLDAYSKRARTFSMQKGGHRLCFARTRQLKFIHALTPSAPQGVQVHNSGKLKRNTDLKWACVDGSMLGVFAERGHHYGGVAHSRLPARLRAQVTANMHTVNTANYNRRRTSQSQSTRTFVAVPQNSVREAYTMRAWQVVHSNPKQKRGRDPAVGGNQVP